LIFTSVTICGFRSFFLIPLESRCAEAVRGRWYGAAGGGNCWIEIQERDGQITFAVRVSPKGSRQAIEGERPLKVRLTVPPVDDRANEALRRLLAERLKVFLSAVRIVAGEKSRRKRVSIAGVTRAPRSRTVRIPSSRILNGANEQILLARGAN
jgi:uncharacterized protein (TIGR00251 family)